MSAEAKVSAALRELAEALQDTLQQVAGEPMGFALMVFPLGRTGTVSYVGNARREDMHAAISDLLRRWEKNMPDIPIHKRH